MASWICVYAIGWWILIISNSPQEAMDVFNGFMLFLLFLYLIQSFLKFISHQKDKVKGAYEEYQSNKIAKDEYLDKLEKLAILKLQGALTDEEFEEQKAKVLKKMK